MGVWIALVAPPDGRAQQVDRRVGVVVTTAVNLEKNEAREIATQLGRALSAELPVDVIAGEEVARRLPPEGVAKGCVAEAECRNDLGGRLEADELLMLVVVRLGERVQIDPTWANVASGDTRSRDAIVLEAGADRAAVFAKAAPLLLPHVEKEERESPQVVVVSQPGTDEAGDGRHFTTGTWIASGVAAGALVGAVVFTFAAKQEFDELDGRGCREEPLCSKGEIAGVRRRALAADLLYGTAAAAGVTALVLYLRSGGQRSEKQAAPPPTVGPGPGGSAGLSVGIGF